MAFLSVCSLWLSFALLFCRRRGPVPGSGRGCPSPVRICLASCAVALPLACEMSSVLSVFYGWTLRCCFAGYEAQYQDPDGLQSFYASAESPWGADAMLIQIFRPGPGNTVIPAPFSLLFRLLRPSFFSITSALRLLTAYALFSLPLGDPSFCASGRTCCWSVSTPLAPSPGLIDCLKMAFLSVCSLWLSFALLFCRRRGPVPGSGRGCPSPVRICLASCAVALPLACEMSSVLSVFYGWTLRCCFAGYEAQYQDPDGLQSFYASAESPWGAYAMGLDGLPHCLQGMQYHRSK